MPATSVPSALRSDKALLRQIAEFDDRIESCEDFLEVLQSPAAQAAVRKDVAALRKRMKAALEPADRIAAAKLVGVLVKDAIKAADAASAATAAEVSERCRAQWAKARGLLAQALVEVGALEPPALRLPLQKEQAALRQHASTPDVALALLADISECYRQRDQLCSVSALDLQRLDDVANAFDTMCIGTMQAIGEGLIWETRELLLRVLADDLKEMQGEVGAAAAAWYAKAGVL